MNKLPAIDVYAARLMMVSFFFPLEMQAIFAGSVSLYFVFRTFIAKQQIQGKNFVWATALCSFYLLYLFSIPLTPDAYRARLIMICGNKASMLFMPFIFAIISPGFGATIRRELVMFVYGCFISCLVANAAIIYKYYFLKSGLHTLSHVDYRISFERYTGIHPTYMAMYLCFSICILLLAAQFTNRAQNAVKYLLLYSLLIFLLALLAKAPLIALVVIAVHYAFVQRKNLYRYKAVLAGTVAVVAAAWLFIPFVSQRVNEMLQAGAGRTGSVADNSVYARQQIWHVDMDLLRQHWLTGIGPGRIYETFLNQMLYYSLGNGTVLNIHDPHNEYVYEWLSFGVLGIILFATILIVYLTRAIRAKDHLFLYLLIILYTTFFTETVLSTQHGVLFFTVFTAMLFYSKPCLPAGRP